MRRKLIQAIVSAGAVLASSEAPAEEPDNPLPPLSSEFKRAIVDWEGGYAGLSVALDEFEAAIDTVAMPLNVVGGDGSLAGVIAGYSWRRGKLLMGIEADLGFGFASLDGQEDEKALLATLRPRIGYDFGKAMPYLTAGVAFAGLSLDESPTDYDEVDYAAGGLAGAGLEMAITRHLSGRVEYLYGRFWDADLGENVEIDLENFHIIRAGLVYHRDAH